MTNEQIELKIKELKELQRKNLKEQKKKEKEELKKVRAKNDKIIVELMRLAYSDKTDDEIINMWLVAIEKNVPEKLEKAKKIAKK